jgi:peptide/nickel transport system substrate-binding protein
MRMRGSKVLPVAMVLALVTAACHGTSTKPNGQGAGGSGTENATFTYSLDSQVMIGWDPSSSYSNEIVAMQNMYETLTRYDSATKTVKPLLATSWTSSDHGKTWTFTLRQGVTFHNGRPMTSADVKAAIERTMKLNQGAAYIWGAVKSIDAPDDQTVVFHLKYANPLDLVASADYAAYIYDTKAAGSQDLNKWFEQGHEAGTGPYELDQWNKGQEAELRLKAYPDYWGGWDGAHYRNVVFQVTPQATTAAQQLQAGDVSVVERLTPQLWQSFENKDGFQTTDSSSWQTLLAMLNTQSGPLADARVRQALAKGIDWSGMMTALHGAAQQISGIVPPGLWGHFDGMELTYDQQGALDLLKQAGYGPGGKPMQLSLTYVQGDADEELVASLMKSDLKKLNIDLSVRGLAWPSQWAQGKSSDPSKRQDIFLFYWWPDYADPYSWFINLYHTEKTPYFNLSYYSNPRIDKMIDKAPSLTATNRAKADALYRQLQKQLLNDAPSVPLYDQAYQRTMLKSVGGFVENPAYPNVVFAYELHPAA